jgi:hypothetical protein
VDAQLAASEEGLSSVSERCVLCWDLIHMISSECPFFGVLITQPSDLGIAVTIYVSSFERNP